MAGILNIFKKPKAVSPACAETPQGPYLTRTVVFGMHLYRQPGEDSSVYFVDEQRGIRKMLVGKIPKLIIVSALFAGTVSATAE